MNKVNRADSKPVIVVDGPAGVGKSTVCKLFAEAEGYCCLDTGALYRAVAWKARAEGISFDDEERLSELCRGMTVSRDEAAGVIRVFVDGQEMGDQIRTGDMGMAASLVSRHPEVRKSLLPLQRQAGAEGGIVAEGRDMGTVVFPNARVKIFLEASPAERANRRYRELLGRGEKVDYSAVLEEIVRRDEQDRNRAVAPLKPAPGAVILDTTMLDKRQAVEAMVNIVRSMEGPVQDSSC